MFELITKIESVFAKSPPPQTRDITGHDCSGCRKIRNAFSGILWWNASPQLIQENYDSLPFFTKEAFHYYLPAYLIYALRDFTPTNTVLEFIVYALSPRSEERIALIMSLFSEDEKDAICKFLGLVVASGSIFEFHAEAKKARKMIGC